MDYIRKQKQGINQSSIQLIFLMADIVLNTENTRVKIGMILALVEHTICILLVHFIKNFKMNIKICTHIHKIWKEKTIVSSDW